MFGSFAIRTARGDVDGESLGLFEWSSPEGAETNDMDALAHANPAMGYGRLTERALLANRKTFPEAKFRSECMCQQVETLLPAPFPDGAWDAGIDPNSYIVPESEIYYGIDMSADRRWVSIAACGLREDGNYHIEVIARMPDASKAVDWFRARSLRGKMNLAFQSRGAPVSGVAEEICAMPNMIRCPLEGPELTNGWARFWDGIAASEPDTTRGGAKIFHLPQPVLDTPAKTMQLRQMGGGMELPDRVKSPDECSPLIACYVAMAAASQIKKENTKIYESAYAKGAELTFL